MKKIIQKTGLRQLSGDDLLLLQKQALMMESYYQQFGDFIFYGCEKKGNTYTPGLLLLNGKYTTFEGYNIPEGEEENQLFVKQKELLENVPYKLTNTDTGYSTWLAIPCTDEDTICIDTLPKEPLLKHIGYTQQELDKKADEADLHKVATSGKYDDLEKKPIIDQSPTKDSENPVSSGGVFEELEKKIDKSSLPLGTIVMWSGDIAKIPGGWALCNGENGTPNLRDRFIVGAGGGYHAGATGGANEIVLNVNQMPAHSHGMDGTGGHSHQSSVGFASGGGGAKNGLTLANVGKYEQYTFHSSYIGNHAHNIHNNGGNQAHENRPPYYALYFIMKIK